MRRYIWHKCERIGQIILHIYEIELCQLVTHESIEIKILYNSPNFNLVQDLFDDRKLNYKVIYDKDSGLLDTYEYLRSFSKEFDNSNIDSFHLINNLLLKLSLKSYNMKLNINNLDNKKNIFKYPITYSECIGISIKYRSPFCVEESNADLEIWNKILEKYSRLNYPRKLLLMGDESSNLGNFRNVIHLSKAGFTLYEQLIISQNVRLFIGLASGFCTAANLYSNPYVIFKNPNHHSAHVAQELINSYRLPLSSNSQSFNFEIPSRDTVFSILHNFS